MDDGTWAALDDKKIEWVTIEQAIELYGDYLKPEELKLLKKQQEELKQ